eukprot:Gb_15937 [translate_table: standard]
MGKSCPASGSFKWNLPLAFLPEIQVEAVCYNLERITEIAGVVLSFNPKPIKGNWNGAGGGLDVIKTAIEKLGFRHQQHISAYGDGIKRRLTGRHETTDINTFSWGVVNHGASFRVGWYLADRQPTSNMDPYVVTSMIAQTTIYGNQYLGKDFCHTPRLGQNPNGSSLSLQETHFQWAMCLTKLLFTISISKTIWTLGCSQMHNTKNEIYEEESSMDNGNIWSLRLQFLAICLEIPS